MAISEKELMRLANGSDVRGVAVEGVADEKVNLTEEAANRIATGFAQFLAERAGKSAGKLRVAVGHDSRISAPAIKGAVLAALSHAGIHALDCGMASTPAMFMSTVFEETHADGSIMITASHLPYNRNGLKFFTPAGGVEHEDITAILMNACRAQEAKGSAAGAERYDLIGRYARHLCEKIRSALGGSARPLEGMHVVVDAGNGAGGFFVSQVLDVLGADTSGSRYLEPDGMFPNHIPNPENSAAMAAIREAVLESHADLGLIFDTDVDRMSAVLETGEDVSRNALIAMMAAILAPDYPGSTIVTDSVTSDELSVFLEQELGLRHLRFKRGYKNVINECIRLNDAGTPSPLAIETSGHGALSENYYLDDGAYLAVKLLIAAARARKEGKRLGSLIEKLGHPAESKEYRIKIVGEEDFHSYGTNVLKAFEQRARERGIRIASPSYEGVRLVFEDGWALLRMSLHDPNLPLNVESRHAGGTGRIAGIVRELVGGFPSLDLGVFQK